MIFSKKILKFVYNSMLFGMPISTYNPYTKVPIHIPARVDEGSTYINLKLNNDEKEYLNNYIHEYNETLSIVPISILEDEKAENYLSINIYNCTSPVFNTDKTITRCEINTYVKDKNTNDNKNNLIIIIIITIIIIMIRTTHQKAFIRIRKIK